MIQPGQTVKLITEDGRDSRKRAKVLSLRSEDGERVLIDVRGCPIPAVTHDGEDVMANKLFWPIDKLEIVEE